MPRLQTNITKIAVIITILTHSLFYIGILGQEYNAQTSPFKRCWKLETDKMTPYGAGSDNKGVIYLPLSNGKITSIDFRTGWKNWESELGGNVSSLPFYDDKNIYIISRAKANFFLHSLSKDFGITNWKVSLDLTGEIFLIDANDKLLISSKDGEFSLVDKNSGEMIWRKNFDQKLSSTPIIFGNQIVFGTLSKKIFFYSIENGNILYQFKTSTPPNVVSIVKNRYLFWGENKGNSYLSDLITKKIIWKVRYGAEISDVLVSQESFLISSLDNFIYYISIKTGKVIWKRRVNERLSFNSIIDNKYAIIVTSASQVADVIDIKSGKLLNQFTIENNNYFINSPHFSDNLFIFPTIKGLITFTNAGLKCPW